MLWWICAVLAALVIAICAIRVGIRATFGPERALLEVTVILFHFRVFPTGKKAAEKDAKKTEKATEEAGERAKEEAKKILPSVTRTQVENAVKMLWPPLRRALGRTRRGIRIKPLNLSVTVGGREDPAAAAERFGALQGCVWTVMPALEQLLDIPDPRIHIGLDFDRPDTATEGTVAASIRIGTLLAVGAAVGIPTLRWLLRLRKQQKEMPASAQPETDAPTAA